MASDREVMSGWRQDKKEVNVYSDGRQKVNFATAITGAEICE